MTKAKIKICVAFSFALALMLLVSCGGSAGVSEEVDAKLLSYESEEIKFIGLEDESVPLKVSDLAALKCITLKAEAEKDSGDKVKVKTTGPLLETLLKEYGKKQSDFTQIRVTAKDGYSVVLSASQLSKDIVLGIMEDGKELAKRNAPLHVIIPGERGMYWARMVTEIEFKGGATGSADETEASKVFNVGSKEYSPKELLELAKIKIEKGSDVTLVADDGLKKFEKIESFARSKISYEGADAPVYISETELDGMKVKHIDKILIDKFVFEF